MERRSEAAEDSLNHATPSNVSPVTAAGLAPEVSVLRSELLRRGVACRPDDLLQLAMRAKRRARRTFGDLLADAPRPSSCFGDRSTACPLYDICSLQS